MYEAKKSCRLSGERPLMSVRNQLTIAAKKTPIDQMKSQIQSGIERRRRKPTVRRERCRSSVTTTRIGWRFGSGGGWPAGSPGAGGSIGGGSKTIQPELMPEQLTVPGPVSYPL